MIGGISVVVVVVVRGGLMIDHIVILCVRPVFSYYYNILCKWDELNKLLSQQSRRKPAGGV